MTKEIILKHHDLILNTLLKYRETHPDFTFWLRSREGVDDGYWFQGDTDKVGKGTYINIGLSNIGTRATIQSIGFQLKYLGDNNIEYKMVIVWRGESDTKTINIYKDIIKNINGFVKQKEDEYVLILGVAKNDDELVVGLNNFLNNEYNQLINLYKKYPTAGLIIPEEKFIRNLNRILSIKEMKSDNSTKSNETNEKNFVSCDLNTILYGPPGTGKTYNTIDKAIEIILGTEVYELLNDTFTREDKTKLFKDWQINPKVGIDDKGRIAFTTFHQSMAYEDFIEGIKPVDPEKSGSKPFLEYKIEPGIFKIIADMARKNRYELSTSESILNITEEEYDEKANFIKIDLGSSTNQESKKKLEYFISEKYITFFEDKNEDLRKIDTTYEPGIKTILEKPTNDTFVIVTFDNSIVKAIGKIISDYEYKKDKENKHIRDVKWILSELNEPAGNVFETKNSEGHLLALNKKQVKKEYFVKGNQSETKAKKNPKNYVLIIDEINRGNIAQIFGELITLIEDTKREGQNEEIKAILPYSKESFSVPSNLYIIGTMNTADRSVEALDSALRRRFSFVEMMPDAEVIKPAVIPSTDINLQQLLTKINERLEVLLSKEHTIGHTYLLGIKNVADLKHAFNNKIIPLLKEYFYGDFGKISMVLGNYFVYQEKDAKPQFLGDYKDMIEEYDEALPWKFKTFEFDKSEDEKFIEAVQKIYTSQKKN